MNITYKVDDWGEAITKQELRTMKKFLGAFTLKTNAVLDIKSSEMDNGVWNEITIKKIKYNKAMDNSLLDIQYCINEIESLNKSINDTKEKMKNWEGMPIYESSSDLICKWNHKINENVSNIEYFYNQYKLKYYQK
tara:strand:- start:2681 stop:3088 length:408 start_codon:yes stop_codon:yes gene_type:complete